MLSPKVKELIVKARIVSFATWQASFSSELIARFQQADDQKYYLTDADCDALLGQKPELNHHVAIAKLLRDQGTEIVSQARANVLVAFPGITEAGGELYPAFRAEACWRDFWQFLRCVTYGIAANRTDFTSAMGLTAMNELYQELKVPLPAMVCGVQGLKQYSLSHCSNLEIEIEMEQFFDHLITQLEQFTA